MVVVLIHFNNLQEVPIVRGPALHERRTSSLKGAESDPLSHAQCLSGNNRLNAWCVQRNHVADHGGLAAQKETQRKQWPVLALTWYLFPPCCGSWKTCPPWYSSKPPDTFQVVRSENASLWSSPLWQFDSHVCKTARTSLHCILSQQLPVPWTLEICPQLSFCCQPSHELRNGNTWLAPHVLRNGHHRTPVTRWLKRRENGATQVGRIRLWIRQTHRTPDRLGRTPRTGLEWIDLYYLHRNRPDGENFFFFPNQAI